MEGRGRPYVLVNTGEAVVGFGVEDKWPVGVAHAGVFEQEAGPIVHDGFVVIVDLLAMHAPAMLADRVEFCHVKHLAELLELVFGLFGLVRVCTVGRFGFLLVEHTLESVEVCAVLHKAGNVNLCADIVAEIAPAVE